MKRVLAILMTVILCMGLCPVALAQDVPVTRLYNVYQDGMLFQQGKDVIFAGESATGTQVQCTLFDSQNAPVAKGMGYVNKSNRFTVTLPAQKGGYEQYTAVLSVDGKEFCRLTDLVFGELWLASGQSNMELGLNGTVDGEKMVAENTVSSPWLRILHTPALPEYEGDVMRCPGTPQRDIPGAVWFRGDTAGIYGTSAVAVFFGQKLQEDLDVPVGVVNVSLGGSSIYSWLSRESIESDTAVKADLEGTGNFFPAETWKDDEHSVTHDMTVNYNKKIEALRYFRPAGMIWYQGESDIFLGWDYGFYTRAFELMQRQNSRLFDFPAGERMPIVYTQIAAYPYGENKLQQFNVELSEIQQQFPESRGMMPIYDVPLTYKMALGTIHPTDKKPVGERMAYVADGLVYGMHEETYTAPTVASAQVKDGSVFVTLRNVGKGLAVKGGTLQGFAVCGKDGIYVGAKAEIVSKDTVRIWSETVPNPVSATYAFAQYNGDCNLYATDEKGLAMPVSVFVTDKSVGKYYWQDRAFTTCDTAQTWRMINYEDLTGFYDVWAGENAGLAYTKDAFSGDAALQITGQKNTFAAKVCYDYHRKWNDRRLWDDRDNDYSRYKSITVALRNEGDKPVTLDSVRFYTSHTTWYAAGVGDTQNPETVIPADGQWHEVTLNLDNLYLFGNECGATYSRRLLQNLYTMRLHFTGQGTVSVDDFRFTPDGSEGARMHFVGNLQNADNGFEWICGLFSSLLAMVHF